CFYVIFRHPCRGCLFITRIVDQGFTCRAQKIRLLAGSLLMLASAGYVQADALQPDPAWQQGTLANGLQ
ncbi:Zn-dependent peptidase, partial [Salmonella enterica subsp. enterica serovar Heidelberg str. RI-11-013343]